MAGWEKAPEYAGPGPIAWGRAGVLVAFAILLVSLFLFCGGINMQKAELESAGIIEREAEQR